MPPCSSLPAFRVAALASLALALPIAALAQGALTPPGAPAPSMKSLAELDASLTALGATTDARVAIDTLPGDATALHIISTPGSYYLRGNLASAALDVSAIRVAADGVVIDLGGFALIGPGAGATSTASGIDTGLNTTTRRRLVVRNGTLSGWYYGVEGAVGTLVEDLAVESSVAGALELGNDSIVRRVSVTGAGTRGIWAGLVENCRVRDISGASASAGIQSVFANDCTVETVTGSSAAVYGILATHATSCRATSVSGSSSTTTGIAGTILTGCSVSNVNGAAGIAYGIQGTVVSNCSAASVSNSNGTAYGILGSSLGTVEDSIVNTVNPAAGNATGIVGGAVSRCFVWAITPATGTGTGIIATKVTDCVVHNVQPSGNSGYGIYLSNTENAATGNVVYNIRNAGIYLFANGRAEGNTIASVGTTAGVTDGAGILAAATSCHIAGNTVRGVTGSDYGIRVTSTLCFVAQNRCTGSFAGAATGAGGVDTPEFNLVAGNRFGPIVSTFAATGEITATNPFSNFSD